jgi:hypothetical protein
MDKDNNTFRGQLIKEVKFVPKTNQWIVNGQFVLSEGLTQDEILVLESAKNKNLQLLKGEAKIKGTIC